MKLRIEKEVSIASAFTHLIAAWDVGPYSWYESVKYTVAGDRVIASEWEPDSAWGSDVLAVLIMEHPRGPDRPSIHVDITGNWIAETLKKALADEDARDAAMQIINEDPAADQNTADLVMQIGAYGRVVFG